MQNVEMRQRLESILDGPSGANRPSQREPLSAMGSSGGNVPAAVPSKLLPQVEQLVPFQDFVLSGVRQDRTGKLFEMLVGRLLEAEARTAWPARLLVGALDGHRAHRGTAPR